MTHQEQLEKTGLILSCVADLIDLCESGLLQGSPIKGGAPLYPIEVLLRQQAEIAENIAIEIAKKAALDGNQEAVRTQIIQI